MTEQHEGEIAVLFLDALRKGPDGVAGGTEFMASVTYDDHIRVPYTAAAPVLLEGVRRLGGAWREYRSTI